MKKVYDLLMFLHAQDDLRRSIMIALAHIHPKQVTISQLSLISGYSRKSKYIYRSKVIDELSNQGILVVNKIMSNVQLVGLNPGNQMMQGLIELCQNNGEKVTSQLLNLIKEATE